MFKFLRGFLLLLVSTLCGCETQSQIDANFLTRASANQTDNVASRFAGGVSNGVVFDSTNGYVRLTQNGTPTNNSELDASWAPEWSSLIGLWRMNETSGSAIADSSGNGNTATVNGGVTLGVVGKMKGAIQVDGSTGYLSVPHSATNTDLTLGSPITISVWTKRLGGYGSFQSMVTRGAPPGGSSTIRNYTFGFNGAQLLFDYNDGTSWSFFQTTAGFTDSNWHDFVFTGIIGMPASARFYVDGSLQTASWSGAGGTTTPDGNNGSLYIGTDWAEYYNGVLDEVAIWSKVLTQDEVINIYGRQSASYSGIFTSRMMDGLSSSAKWTNFSRIPTLPFYKELPDAGLSEIPGAYSSQSANLMTGIIGLWHLDEASGASVLTDTSGANNNGTPISGVTTGAPGKLGTAALFNGSSNSYIQLATTENLTGDFSVSTWANFSGSIGSNQVLFGSTLNGADLNFYGGYFRLYSGCCGDIAVSSTPTTVGSWHHYAATRSGNGLNNVALYIDGNPVGVGTWDSSTFIINTLGGSPANSLFSSGYMDETAVWTRSLSATEVYVLYRRGADRIKFQIRSCSIANPALTDCTDGTLWQGPDSTNQTYFSELNNTLANATTGAVQTLLPNIIFGNFLSLIIPANRYFQYRAIMESDDTGTACNYGAGATWCSPELKLVTVDPGHSL